MSDFGPKRSSTVLFFNFLIEKTTEGRKYLLNNTISYYVSTLRNSNDIFSKKGFLIVIYVSKKGIFQIMF